MSFAHLTIATRNVERTRDFFAATLGWKPINRPTNIDRPAAWLSIAPGQELHILEVRDFKPSAFDQEFGRHFAINVPLGEFADLKSRLIANDAELMAPIRPTPFERFLFRDPNGYVFEVVDAGREPEV